MYESRSTHPLPTSVVLSDRDIADAVRLLTTLLGHSGQPINAALPDQSARQERKLGADGNVEPTVLLDLARELFHERKARQRFFSRAMFSEPAWDMLLALYIARTADPRQTVSRLTRLIYTPMTTALRWAHYLEKENFVVRSEHPTDSRQVLITLTDFGRLAIEDYLCVILRDRVSPVEDT